jgi:hypothetical protein
MDSQTTPPRRSRLAPEPDYTASAFVAQEQKPETPHNSDAGRTAQPSSTGEGLPAPLESSRTGSGPMRVIVTDIHMSFWSMVEFMVKLAFATMPAAIIITMVVLAMIAIAERLVSFRW